MDIENVVSFVEENKSEKKGNYLFDSLKDNNNECKFRITSPFTAGYMYWIDNPDKPEAGKPVYTDSCISLAGIEGLRPFMGSDKLPTVPKPFIAVSVYNYTTKQIELFTITQKSIMKALIELLKDEDWGDPMQYDIKIKRTGEKLSTEYSLISSNKGAMSKEVVDAVIETYCNPENMLKNVHPFDDPSA